jgi:Protein phosphatase 2C
LKLVGAVTQGSGAINEDGYGHLGSAEDISAAWVMDGVTGINGRNYLPAGSDAAWLVGQAHRHLESLAGLDKPLEEILSRLIDALYGEWRQIADGLSVPVDYDPPAACLILVKRYGKAWRAVRLGDSCLLVRNATFGSVTHTASPNNLFDRWLSGEAAKRRDLGQLDIKALMNEFRPQLAAARSLRNTAGGYSILEAHPRAKEFAEYIELGTPEELLLCTDGYYRAVDHYLQFTDEGLIDASASAGGVDTVLRGIRAAESADPHCQTFFRFKPADDATAVMLSSR